MKSRELTEPDAASACAPSVCESCHEPFTCGAQASGCWCMEVKLTESARAALRAQFKSCLCRACLERFAQAGVDA